MFVLRVPMQATARVAGVVLALALAATGLGASPAAEPESATAEREMVANVFGEMVEKPQYGGTIAIAITESPTNFDPWFGYSVPEVLNGEEPVFERLGDLNWAFRAGAGGQPSRYISLPETTGELAESWEVSPDLKTYTFRIRRGIYWQDKGEVAGREFDAHDVLFTFQRNWGLEEFSEKGGGPAWWKTGQIPYESIEAPDRWTFVIKTHTPALDTLDQILCANRCPNFMVAPEVIRAHGDMSDWRNVVGTGPFMLTDFVPGSSVTYTRNPNYWNADPLHPGNQLPYADEVKYYVIPEPEARVAAFRSGRVALPGMYWSSLTFEQRRTLAQTNPELVEVTIPGEQSTTFTFRLDRPPFDNKNVRIAMQKSIDAAQLNDLYYDGKGDTTPYGYVTTLTNGMNVPYAQWSDDIKAQYEYDPEEAERLLDEAGYPRGADGIRFKAGWDVTTAWGHDVDLAQAVTTYFDAIGVDVEVNELPDGTTMQDRLNAGSHGGITAGCCRHAPYDAYASMRYRFYGDPGLYHGATDETFNALMDQIAAVTDNETMAELVRAVDLHYISEMWSVSWPLSPIGIMHQPWLKGYTGQLGAAMEHGVYLLPYLWIDQELKAQMGH